MEKRDMEKKAENRNARIPRILLAAPSSGSGKTMITCGILQALKNRGLSLASFKCGPDYIDPLFHEKVLRTKSRNLDLFLAEEGTARALFWKNAAGSDLAVIEGAMGYYDGLGGISSRASAWEAARVTDAPTILIVNARGMSLSLLAQIKGFLEFQRDSRIRGVIFNQMSAHLYPEMKKLTEERLGISVYGYVPARPDCVIESRHLGLVLPDEVSQIEETLQKLAEVLEETLDLEGICRLAREAPELEEPQLPEKIEAILYGERAGAVRKKRPRIAVARDEAFCFLYEDNLELLRELGAELVFFSPIRDRALPEAEGILLCGGYPELYARELSQNQSMRESIQRAVGRGMPCMAECGGFLYLHDQLEDMEGRFWPMAGVIPARAYAVGKLGRFGYIEITCQEKFLARAHEFHYFESEKCGEDCFARKPLGKRGWRCMHRTESLLAGFPHLYYYSNPSLALEFCEKCAGIPKERERRKGADGQRDGVPQEENGRAWT